MNNIKSKKENYLLVFLKGILIGIVNLIPGISGGTIALILGIYNKLILSLSFFFSHLLKLKKLSGAKEFYFLLFLVLGVVTGIFLSSRLIEFLLLNFSIQTFSFFIGLILSSAFLILGKIKKFKTSLFIFFLIGFSLGFFISSPTKIIIPHSPLNTFFSGVLSASSMVLPGISGAYILIIFGQYEYLISSLNSLNISVILIFIIGVALGLFLISKFLKWLLLKYQNQTIIFLIGLMLGGLRTLFEKSIMELKTMIIFIILGFILLFILKFLAKQINRTKYERKK